MHPVDVSMINFLTDHFQDGFKIDISDKVAVSVNGLPDSLGCDGIYFQALLVNKIFSFQKYDFEDRAPVFKNMIIKIDFGKHFDHACFRQSTGNFAKVFLIGESIRNIVEQGRNNTLARQEFYIRNDIGEMVS
jgi:hypothetical protein